MRKILFTGSTGQIGSELMKNLESILYPEDELYLLKNNRDPKLPSRDNIEVIYRLDCAGPYDIALHFAANIHTKFGNNPAYNYAFWRDNVELTRRVCNVSNRVLMASSDYIFSGKADRQYNEDDLPCPSSNYYGQTKAEAEKIVLEKSGAVIRIQTLLGVPHNLIVDKVYDSLDGKPAWPFWNDNFVRPSYFPDLVNVLDKVVNEEKKGVYHVACSGNPLSRFQIAEKVLEAHKKLGISCINGKLEQEPRNADFPAWLDLSTEKTQKELGLKFSTVDEAILVHVKLTRSQIKAL